MILIKVIFLLKYSLSPSVISYTKVWHVPFRDFGYFLCLLVSSGIFTFSSLFRMHLKSKYSKVSYTFFHNYKITAGTSQIATSYHKSVKLFASSLALFFPSWQLHV